MSRRTWWLCAALIVGGCAPGNPGLVIGGIVAPSDYPDCVYDTANAHYLTGVLDVAAVTVEYRVVPLYFNQLLNLSTNGSTTAGPPRADPNVITVSSAEVELRDVTGAPLALPGFPNPFSVPATGFIPSSDGTTAGSATGAITVIPPVYGEVLRTTAIDTDIIVAIRAVGTTAGGADVLSPEFEWPVHVCLGCLFACQVDSDGEPLCAPSCTPGQDSLTVTPNACVAGAALGGCLP